MRVFDPLYGLIAFSEEIESLAKTSAVQRLRKVRLSNIDSFDNPGISQISRFEHVVGACYLTTQIRPSGSWPRSDTTLLQAAALLHDWGIAPFGHIVEEGMAYAGERVSHEMKLELLAEPRQDELGGIDLQLHLGQPAGIKDWTQSVFGAAWREALTDLLYAMQGKGRFGSLISSDVDVDNLDNVVRVAHHMGLTVDRHLPVRIVQEIAAIADDKPVFTEAGIGLLEEWLTVRHRVYSRLMPSRADFAAKAMVVYAVARGLQDSVLAGAGSLWRLTDREFVQELLEADSADVRVTARDWQTGNLWGLSHLFWMEGETPPSQPELWKLSKQMCTEFLRPCLCYAIKEKRVRELRVLGPRAQERTLGTKPSVWLLGLAARGPRLTAQQNKLFLDTACENFSSRPAGEATDPAVVSDPSNSTLSLFGE